ncbi:unnamed protein product [Linum trigynum]|uniref:NIF system FeS cluster assembly NifU C-terminal domain-containing protein n=1 Tax=Linum trigynum TaxID=586398 RepID=A0AAV2FK88_9ROSI
MAPMASAATSKVQPHRCPILVSSSSSIHQFQQQSIDFPSNHGISSRRIVCKGKAFRGTAICAAASSSAPSSSGLYTAQTFDLTAKNVDLVLDDVRPYLIADGGNVDVVSVEDGVISLQLQGACGSCPSSTTTMKMGIERVLKEKFGDAVKEIRQVGNEDINGAATVEAVNGHLEILRPAIKNYGGSVDVLSIKGGECQVRYTGPESIGSGVKAAIKEKFPDIQNVVFVD